ncbi:hypothetical protein [Solimonas marina]|uniref:Uncharacterized protein n=1 Tax=Solimonas marina TaxID=2714601 RepID=A0A969W6U0_9GAMM|nr:hypothetical protein [Solimonas marina]NKF21731.1 hypothetical protein [Solimonas marina]
MRELEIDLLPKIIEKPEPKDIRIVRQRFQSLLYLTHVSLSEAPITVAVGVADEKLLRYERLGRGVAVECLVRLTLAPSHSATATARCRASPHDPERSRVDASVPGLVFLEIEAPRNRCAGLRGELRVDASYRIKVSTHSISLLLARAACSDPLAGNIDAPITRVMKHRA